MKRTLFTWRFLRRKDAAALLDALRRSTELLDHMTATNASPYWYEEREHIVAVSRRLIRAHDPKAETDRTVR